MYEEYSTPQENVEKQQENMCSICYQTESGFLVAWMSEYTTESIIGAKFESILYLFNWQGFQEQRTKMVYSWVSRFLYKWQKLRALRAKNWHGHGMEKKILTVQWMANVSVIQRWVEFSEMWELLQLGLIDHINVQIELWSQWGIYIKMMSPDTMFSPETSFGGAIPSKKLLYVQGILTL